MKTYTISEFGDTAFSDENGDWVPVEVACELYDALENAINAGVLEGSDLIQAQTALDAAKGEEK